MFCDNCGANIPDEAKFCIECGTGTAATPATPAQSPAPAIQPPAPPQPARPAYPPPPAYAPPQPVYAPPAQPYAAPPVPQPYPPPPPQYNQPPVAGPVQNREPLGVGSYIGMFFLMAIPVVNFILLMVWAFGGWINVNKRNYARAILLLSLIAVGLWLIVFLIVLASGGAFLRGLN